MRILDRQYWYEISKSTYQASLHSSIYLRKWRAQDGKITEYTKPHTELVAKRVKAESTGFAERLYELQENEPAIAQQVEEKFFKPIDTWASASLDLLERSGNNAKWDDHHRSAWSRFIISLLLRCPEDISLFRDAWNAEFIKTDNKSENSYIKKRETDDPKTLSEFLNKLSRSTKERNIFHVLNTLIDNERIGKTINDMIWHVIDLSERAHKLLTSDRTVIRTNLIEENAHIVLPISPRRLFIACNDEGFLRKIVAVDHDKLVRECNRQTVESAVRFVYGIDDFQQKFIANRFGKTKQVRIIEQIAERRGWPDQVRS